MTLYKFVDEGKDDQDIIQILKTEIQVYLDKLIRKMAEYFPDMDTFYTSLLLFIINL